MHDLGFKGTILFGRIGNRHLDDPRFLPIFRQAEALDVPILLHPQTPSPVVQSEYYSGFRPEVNAALATYGLGWHYETGLQFVRLVLAGVLDTLPRLQLIFGHWGEPVIFFAERLATINRVAGLAQPFQYYLRNNLYLTASGMFLPQYLEQALAIVGANRLLFSTDFPYQYRTGRDVQTLYQTLRFGRICHRGLFP